jgi:hypothetical protein
MQHRNAPLTPNGRRRLVALVEEEGLTFEAAASNVTKAHTWVSRWREADEEQRRDLSCLQDRSSRLPRLLTSREATTGGKSALRVALPRQPLHIDTKRHARFREPGHAVTGRRTERSRGAGWEFVHTLVDDCSHIAHSEIHDNERAQTVTEFTRRAWTGSWRGESHRASAADDGTASGLSYRSRADRRTAPPHWLSHYNESRRHSALGNRPPMARVRNVLWHDS